MNVIHTCKLFLMHVDYFHTEVQYTWTELYEYTYIHKFIPTMVNNI